MTERNFVSRLIAWVLQRKLVRAALRYTEHRGALLADSITYRALFSVFAAVLLGFSVAGIWLEGNPEAWEALINAVNAAIPGLVGPNGIIDPDNAQVSLGLSFAGVASLVALVAASIGAIGSLRSALRQLADHMHDDVAIYWVYLRNLALAAGIGLSLLATAAVTVLSSASLDTLLDIMGISDSGPIASVATRGVSLLIVFALDTAVVAVLFRVLSGLKPSARALWAGAAIGGLGLLVLQELSGLFVRGATANPLLASFASLIALLLWFNLSSQVILIASCYIITGVDDEEDRVHSRFGAATFAQRRVRSAERVVDAASRELRSAREAEEKERTSQK